MIDPIKHELFKEASSKVEAFKRKTDSVHNQVKTELLEEAENRVIKASLDKESMAAQIGVSDLKNSSWNTEWSIPDKSNRILKIEQDIESVFAPYLYSIVEGKQQPIKGGISLPNDPESPPNKPATFVLRFAYRRSLLPLKGVAPDAYNNAVNAIGLMEKALPGFKQFIDDVQSSSIPIMPFYHTSTRDQESGGVTQGKLQTFIQQERQKYQDLTKTLKTSNGQSINSDKFYSEHANRISSGQPVRLSENKPHTRIHKNSEIDQINEPSILMRAIADKIRSGFTIDWSEMDNSLESEKKSYIALHNLDVKNPADVAIIKNYEVQFKKRKTKILKAYKSGCLPIEGESTDLNWGVIDKQTYRPGLPQESTGKHAVCPILTTDDLKLILKTLTKFDPKMKSSDKHKIQPDEFLVTRQSMIYKSNGWDSEPSNPELNVLTMPAIKQIPNGQIVYDRDQGNMGRVHLMKYWKGTAGKTGLFDLISRWGKWADDALQKLKQKDTILTLHQNSNQDKWTSFHSWINIIGGKTKGNRTNAETILEIINKYPDWNSFYYNHLGKSLASELAVYAKIKDNPGWSDSISKFHNNQMSWDQLTLEMAKQGLTTVDATDKSTMIDANGFNLLVQYGYQVAKMLDFAFGIMSRSCEEKFNNRQDGVEEKIYGRQYSTTSGKYSEGQVMFGVRYAFNAPEIGIQDPELLKLVRHERGKHHIKNPGQAGDVYRQTKNPQIGAPVDDSLVPGNSNSTIKIVENVTYWVGQTASTSNWLKPVYDDLANGLSWEQALDYFKKKYPGISQQLGVVYEPMNANLQRIEHSSKNALAKVQEKLKMQNKQLDIIYVDKNGNPEFINGSDSQEQPDQIKQPQQTQFNSTYLETPDIDTGIQNQEPINQPEELNTQTVGNAQSKSMPSDVDFIGRKDNSKRRLFKKDINPETGKIHRSELEKKLIKIANKYESIGENQLSVKIDKVLRILCLKNMRDTI